ncbi:MAG: hypothetical protein E7049_03225 [Lentisphaerae bacterium]|nr:hypothetical protein [Lentisphaerota bacterium]
MKHIIATAAMLLASALCADVYIIDGQRIEGEVHEIGGVKTICTDQVCMMLPPDAVKVEGEEGRGIGDEGRGMREEGRIAQGYMKVPEFLAFINGEASAGGGKESPLAGKSWWIVVILAFFGGLAMNLTPCVLPMVPINLMVIGKSATRGALYGLGIALAYGTLGILAAAGGMAFGEIQSNPWFNSAVAVLFVLLALALMEVFAIDLSRGRGTFAAKRATMLPGLFAFVMGAVSAILAGACVAPILIAVLLLTADLSAQGNHIALALPFVLGLGMALPWPFAGAGMQVLPKPGAWMKTVNKIFGLVVLGLAAWYGFLAYRGFAGTKSAQSENANGVIAATPSTFADALASAKRPVLVDCWATWCKNCTAMEKFVFTDASVKDALKDFTVIKLQAEDMRELRKLPGFEDVMGLPAFAIYQEQKAE